MISPAPMITDVAEFCGWQETGIPGLPDFELWTLTRDLGRHPEGSTLARSTIDALLSDL